MEKNNYIVHDMSLDQKELLDFFELRDCDGVLYVCLQNDKEEVFALCFDSYVIYRKCDESYALRLIDDMGRHDVLNNTLCEVLESDFIHWFVDQSYGYRTSADYHHYVILTVNDVIEVIAQTPPVLKVDDGNVPSYM